MHFTWQMEPTDAADMLSIPSAWLHQTCTNTMLYVIRSVKHSAPEPSIKRVWPTSLLVRSRLRRAVTSQLGTQGRHVCCHTGVVWHEVCKCELTTICVHSAASPFHDYLCMLVMMRWPHSPLSPGYVTTDCTVFVSPAATSLRLRTE